MLWSSAGPRALFSQLGRAARLGRFRFRSRPVSSAARSEGGGLEGEGAAPPSQPWAPRGRLQPGKGVRGTKSLD